MTQPLATEITAGRPEYALHMGEAMRFFDAHKVKQIGRRVFNEHLGALGATELTTWSTKTAMTLEMQVSNGGCTLIVRPGPVEPDGPMCDCNQGRLPCTCRPPPPLIKTA